MTLVTNSAKGTTTTEKSSANSNGVRRGEAVVTQHLAVELVDGGAPQVFAFGVPAEVEGFDVLGAAFELFVAFALLIGFLRVGLALVFAFGFAFAFGGRSLGFVFGFSFGDDLEFGFGALGSGLGGGFAL